MQSNHFDAMPEVVLPGFRFHPTDEELVGFYLHRKVQQKTLPFEVITQLDIYKYDPWDFPRMAVSGENVWYFFCLRDQKYRNSTRPNRVTKGGFWKATGPDRAIYTLDGSKCIGLKKSLVFYKGKAAKGTKTDWVMHEFRLPVASATNASKEPPKKRSMLFEESWAVCRIFKKRTMGRKAAGATSWAPSLSDKILELDCSSQQGSSFETAFSSNNNNNINNINNINNAIFSTTFNSDNSNDTNNTNASLEAQCSNTRLPIPMTPLDCLSFIDTTTNSQDSPSSGSSWELSALMELVSP